MDSGLLVPSDISTSLLSNIMNSTLSHLQDKNSKVKFMLFSGSDDTIFHFYEVFGLLDKVEIEKILQNSEGEVAEMGDPLSQYLGEFGSNVIIEFSKNSEGIEFVSFKLNGKNIKCPFLATNSISSSKEGEDFRYELNDSNKLILKKLFEVNGGEKQK